jgi:hypothetical protein
MVTIVVLGGVGIYVSSDTHPQTSSTTLGVVPGDKVVVPAYRQGPIAPSLGTLAAWVEFTYKKLAGTHIHVTEIDLTISQDNPDWATFYVRATNADMNTTYAYDGKSGWRADYPGANDTSFIPANLPKSVSNGMWTSTVIPIKGW